MQKTILITGASSGIGKSTVALFSARGWQVAATMRTPEKDDSLAKLPNVKLFALDVLNDASIANAIALAQQAFGKIDVVVNNAGYAAVGAFEAASDVDIQKQFNTNVFGLMRVTRALLPHFRANKSGTFINIASVGGQITFPLYSLYHGTKWAVEGFSESLHFELKSFGIKIKIIEPGAIKTDFYNRSMDFLKKDGLNDYDVYSDTCFKNMGKVSDTAPGPEIVAEKIFLAATDTSSQLRYAVGSNAPFLLLLRRMIPNSWFFGLVRLIVERKK